MRLDGLSTSYAHTRPSNPPLPVATWCADARQDPITGLVAFPDFNFVLPEILSSCRMQQLALGIAIGDVDNLKEYVENTRSRNAGAYGHMAGCALMQTLGQTAARWFTALNPSLGCAATFGGDEIIIVLAVRPGDDTVFESLIVDLRNEFYDSLPRSVSFGWTVAFEDPVSPVDEGWKHYRSRSTELLSAVDRTLFRQKSALRAAGLPCDGFVAKALVS